MLTLEQIWLNPVLTWGVGPFVSYALGFVLFAIPLELLLKLKWMENSMISYRTPRVTALSQTQSKIPLSRQAFGSLWTVIGPPGIVGSVLGYFIFSNILPPPSSTLPSWGSIFLTILIMEPIGDFFLYWGHRIQHESEFLWQFHKLHHSLDTPSPIGTLYIHDIDATLQGALPILLTILICRPHPIIAYIYIFLRIGENTINHCGLDSPIVNALTLKFLPGRASIAHHDAHHKYSNHSRKALNYGENFWIWDFVFGTLRSKQL